MVRLLCEPEDRIGSLASAKASVLTSNSTIRGSVRGSGFVGLGDDGAEQIKAHPWFKNVDWDSESSLASEREHADLA
jgi:hypothetical protein